MDLHPEDLIDREAAGELSPAEREHLDAHAALCPACRLERRVRHDFDRLGEDVEPNVPALVARALRPDVSRPRFRARARFTRLRVALLAAALLSLTGLAAAAVRWPSVRESLGLRAHAEVPAPAIVEGAPARPGTTRAVGPVAASPNEAPAAATSIASALSTPIESSALAPPSPVLHRSLRTPEATDDAAGLFGNARAALRRGERGSAAASYQRLLASFPRSAEAHEARIAIGQMLFDEGDAAGALPYFEAYATGGGPLREEALLGEALALRAMGRTGDERDAWTALVDAYPGSIHADRARARLAELGR